MHICFAGRVKVDATLPDGAHNTADLDQGLGLELAGRVSVHEADCVAAGHEDLSSILCTTTPAGNIHNPNSPPKEVKYGEQTGDEMSLVFYQLIVKPSPMLDRMREMFAPPDEGRRNSSKPAEQRSVKQDK